VGLLRRSDGKNETLQGEVNQREATAHILAFPPPDIVRVTIVPRCVVRTEDGEIHRPPFLLGLQAICLAHDEARGHSYGTDEHFRPGQGSDQAEHGSPTW
jgi:hypothetical protein